jgi:hypothetical protein
MELWRKKNTDTRICFPLTKTDGTLNSGAAGLDSEYASFNTSDHGGAAPSFGDMTHEATEIGSTGMYYLDVQAAEINADFTIIQIKSTTTGAAVQAILIRTMGPNHYDATQDADKLWVDVREKGDSTVGLTTQEKADANAEADTALIDVNLDHLCKTATAGVDMTTEVVDGTIISRIISNSDTSLFVPATHSLQVVGADVAAVHIHAGNIDTQVGTAGAGLSAVPWNASWDAEVESEANDALVALNLDHLCKVATAAADMTTEVVDNSILSRVLSNGDTSVFDPSTDGLQPTRDQIVTIDGITDDILVDTGELQTEWVDGGRLDLLIDAIKTKTDGLNFTSTDVKATLDGETVVLTRVTGAVASDGSNTSAYFKTDLVSTKTDAYKDSYLKMTSGTCVNQVKKISGYNGSTKFITLSSALTDTPSAADTFMIINE